MEKTYIIERFVSSCQELAFIRDSVNDEVLFANEPFWELTKGVKSYDLARRRSVNPKEHSGYSFCEYVEQEFKKTKQPTFAFEEFGDKFFVSSRFLIEYKNNPAILVIITESKGDDAPFNDIYSCQTKKYLYP
ncbi:hypothetical protein [Vibrio vulnificus]|uniref:hypothetical protein n=1 Tax=Vibrio vulnificus TaxID=672 RepID=UPI001029568C|nr:hypothetical protein [Vibrio vulnificus]RZP95310.1 hypothetical protein D8T54_14135 [Vibrio vulnificus]